MGLMIGYGNATSTCMVMEICHGDYIREVVRLLGRNATHG